MITITLMQVIYAEGPVKMTHSYSIIIVWQLRHHAAIDHLL